MDSRTNIEQLFLYKRGVYSKNLQFLTILFGLLIILLLTKFFPKTYGFVILLFAFTLYFSNSFVRYHDSAISDFNVKTLQKQAALQTIAHDYLQNRPFDIGTDISLQYLHNDADLIHFLHSLIPLYEYNPNEFYLVLKGTNNLLQLKQQIEDYYSSNNTPPQTTPQMLEDALLLRSQTINNIHNFVYSVPKINAMFKYIEVIITRFTVLITRNTDIIYNFYTLYNKSNGINAQTKVISYNETKPYDALLNHPINVTKHHTENKLVPFYI